MGYESSGYVGYESSGYVGYESSGMWGMNRQGMWGMNRQGMGYESSGYVGYEPSGSALSLWYRWGWCLPSSKSLFLTLVNAQSVNYIAICIDYCIGERRIWLGFSLRNRLLVLMNLFVFRTCQLLPSIFADRTVFVKTRRLRCIYGRFLLEPINPLSQIIYKSKQLF